jgi:hypothetical protein
VGWNEEEGFWSTEDFHDLKFNEEKQVELFLQVIVTVVNSKYENVLFVSFLTSKMSRIRNKLFSDREFTHVNILSMEF